MNFRLIGAAAVSLMLATRRWQCITVIVTITATFTMTRQCEMRQIRLRFALQILQLLPRINTRYDYAPGEDYRNDFDRRNTFS